MPDQDPGGAKYPLSSKRNGISSDAFGRPPFRPLLCTRMNAQAMLTRAGDMLRNRVLRNVAFWALIGLLSHGISMEEDALHHYGFATSRWYWPVFWSSLGLQMILVYANNLALVPRLLVRRRRIAYAASLVLLLAVISTLEVLGLKRAAGHIDIGKLQLIALPTESISTSWASADILHDIRSCMMGNLVWVSLFTMAWYMNDYARQRRAADLARRQQSETELAFLRSQLAPHFLFNTLNNIYALTLRESGAAPEAMLKLSAILRALLYDSGTPQVPFENEAALIRAYTDLELLRLKKLEQVNIEIRSDGDYAVPPLLWLPVLENIFKHGTRLISEVLFIDFEFIAENNRLRIRGRNYCRELPAGESPQRGIGLSNLERRLQLLYPGKHSFRTGCRDHIFITEIDLRLG